MAIRDTSCVAGGNLRHVTWWQFETCRVRTVAITALDMSCVAPVNSAQNIEDGTTNRLHVSFRPDIEFILCNEE